MLKVDEKKKKIMIPTMMTFLLKKATWAERNYIFDVSGTWVFRTVIDNRSNEDVAQLKELLKK